MVTRRLMEVSTCLSTRVSSVLRARKSWTISTISSWVSTNWPWSPADSNSTSLLRSSTNRRLSE